VGITRHFKSLPMTAPSAASHANALRCPMGARDARIHHGRPDTSGRTMSTAIFLERTAQRGLSLIEQIMVLAILAVLASVAAPSFGKLLNTNRVQVAQADFISGLTHARETAVVTGKRSLFCPSRDGSSCSGDTRWDNGWLLGHDADGNDQPDHGALYVGPSYHGSVSIQSSAGRRFVRFNPDGSASGSNLTLIFCGSGDAATALSVVVSNAGRVRGAPATGAQAASCLQRQSPRPKNGAAKSRRAGRLSCETWRPKLDSKQRPSD
jgi:type IV fimbrial biogenesis protein FimT